MLRRRVIPCLDVANGRVVKGVNFVSLRDAGDPVAGVSDDATAATLRIAPGAWLALVVAAAATGTLEAQPAGAAPAIAVDPAVPHSTIRLTVNGVAREVEIEYSSTTNFLVPITLYTEL